MTDSTRQDLLAALASWGLDLNGGVTDETSLLRSGMLDSMALFNLLLWVEERIAKPVDPTKFDLLQEWDTIAAILRFVDSSSAALPSVSGTAPLRITTNRAIDSGPRREVQIVRYTDEFADEIAKLQLQLWSPDRDLNRAFLAWKYKLNPYACEPLLYLAISGRDAVAMRGFCGSLWETDATGPLTVYCADDLVILPEHQSRGIFAKFTDAALPDLAARGQANFFSLSALRVTRLQSLATGSRSTGTLNPAGRTRWSFAAAGAAENLLRRAPVLWRAAKWNLSGDSARRAFARLDQSPGKSAGSVTISVARKSRPKAMAQLIRRLSYDGRIRHVRDERFFAWRFESPLHEYRFVLAEEEGGLAGYLIVQRGLSENANPHRVNIVDWEAATPAIAADLLATAVQWGDFPELVMWTACVSADRIATLDRAGFAPTDLDQTARGQPCLLIRGTQGPGTDADASLGGRALLDLANWDMRMIYTYAV